MSLAKRVLLLVLLATAAVPPALARDEANATATPGLVAFNSDEGMARLSRSTARADFAALANQFESQSNIAFSGPTTVAIVLNAARSGSSDLPRDYSRIRPEDGRWIPKGIDLSVPRYTQENVIAKGTKTRAQVMGEPILDGKQTRDGGYQLRQIDELFRAHGMTTRLVVVDDGKTDAEIRADLVQNLKRAGDYVVVNYRREDVGQRGGPHHSPLAAYDQESDSVLVMDVNPASAGWVWMPVTTLAKGMRTFDQAENRGYVLVQSR